MKNKLKLMLTMLTSSSLHYLKICFNTVKNQNKIENIDVDLYISAKSVFRFIAPLLRVGTVILIDDWYCFKPGENKGLQKAFNEFLDLNKNIECEHWKNYSTFGRSFFVKKI